jgi:hypothetical protein
MTDFAALGRAEASSPASDLTPARIAILAVVGAVLWFLAAMFIRFAGPLGAFRGVWVPILYALAGPLLAPAVLFGRRAGGAGRDRILASVAVMCVTALFLDGVALAWFRGLYGSDPAVILGGAAWLLWGVGVALILALFTRRR